MLLFCNAPVEGCFPPPQDPDRLSLHAALRRLLKEGRAALEAVQVCEVPLPAPKRQEQDHLRKDPLLGKSRATGPGDPGELESGQAEAAGT